MSTLLVRTLDAEGITSPRARRAAAARFGHLHRPGGLGDTEGLCDTPQEREAWAVAYAVAECHVSRSPGWIPEVQREAVRIADAVLGRARRFR
jgi:hypothetical protein